MNPRYASPSVDAAVERVERVEFELICEKEHLLDVLEELPKNRTTKPVRRWIKELRDELGC